LMSLEGPANAALEIGVRALARRSAVVAAAGNGGPNASPSYPAAYPEVIAVSAVDQRLRPYRLGTRGAYVELAAPGVDIRSAGPDGGTERWSGTSFAAPFVAAALLRSLRETGGDAAAARTLLAQDARDIGARGRDPIFGYGLLQVPPGDC
ncbi:MAG: S8 family serine peptidase, partial [Pseudomonadota bacterium]